MKRKCARQDDDDDDEEEGREVHWQTFSRSHSTPPGKGEDRRRRAESTKQLFTCTQELQLKCCCPLSVNPSGPHTHIHTLTNLPCFGPSCARAFISPLPSIVTTCTSTLPRTPCLLVFRLRTTTSSIARVSLLSLTRIHKALHRVQQIAPYIRIAPIRHSSTRNGSTSDDFSLT